MIVSFTIDLTDVEQDVLNQRLQRLGMTMDQWAQQVILTRIDGLARPHKLAKARELLDKFQAAPSELQQKLMDVQVSVK